MDKFVVVEAVVVVPGVTLAQDAVLTPSADGKFYAPGTLVEIPKYFLNDETKFSKVRKFTMTSIDSFLKGVEANLDKELNVGDAMITFDAATLEFTEETYVASTTQLATLASGFSIPLPANGKQKYNRINKLNDVFNLGIDMKLLKTTYGIESVEKQKLDSLVAAITEAL